MFVHLGYAQSETWDEKPLGKTKLFNGKKGKWHFSGQSYYKDNLIYYTNVRGSVKEDSTIYYFEEKWFYQNGGVRRKIFIDFKKPKRAKVTDEKFSNSGELIEKKHIKAKRKPEQIDPNKLNWKEKK